MPDSNLHRHSEAARVPRFATLGSAIVWSIVWSILWTILWAATPLALGSEASDANWQRQVRPLLASRCYACHGPDRQQREADLRLDQPSTWDAGLVVGGDPDASLLWQRVSSRGDDRMPPAPDHQALTATELQLVRAWIEAGGVASQHWSHRPIRRPAMPTRRAPWVRNEIDWLLQASYERAGQTPRLASRATLERRLALTLIGLPMLGNVDQPLTLPSTGSRALSQYVEALMASAHFGEHSAAPWLDVARYADTHGYHIDAHRDMWRWRDWVIESYNENLPFDRFTLHQLAGDLLPPASSRYATMRQRLATGFLRNTPINSEDGAIAEEFLSEYAAERTVAIGAAWLGQTMQCCRCHDHKNDPIQQIEFYQLSAFFNDLPEKGVDGRHGNAAPVMSAPTWNDELRWQAAMAQRETLQRSQQRARDATSRSQAAQRWEQAALEAGARPGPNDYLGRLTLTEAEGRKLGAEPGPAARLLGRVTRLPSLRRESGFSLAMTGSQRVFWQLPPESEFTIAVWVYLTTSDAMTMLTVGNPAIELQLNSEGVALRERGEVRAQAPPTVSWPKRQWRLLAWSYENRTHRITLNGDLLLRHVEPPPPEARTGDQRHRFETGLHASLGGPATSPKVVNDPNDPAVDSAAAPQGLRGLMDEAYVFARALSVEELQRLAADDPLIRILNTPPDKRTDTERQFVREAWLLETDRAFAERSKQLRALETSMERMQARFPQSMVMAVGPERPTHLLQRGDYQRPGPRVQRGVPAWLPKCAPSEDGRLTRADLARWLTSPEHPLTARVVANRIWQQHFGRPLAPTPDDLGLGGEAPAYPELLDFLASELLDSGWDQKRLHRLIVSSATYLQRHPQLPGAAESSDRLLTAEQLRDSALAVSGLLSPRVGGPSVFPYQPEGLWEELARDPNLYSAQVYREDDGEGLYRRSLYTFWKRSSPPPTLALLGAPSRETCVAARSRAAGPQRSLVLLNDPIFVEAARHVAVRLTKWDTIDQRVVAGVRQVLRREPTDVERSVLVATVSQLLDHYQHHADAAERLVHVGRSAAPTGERAELAAWTTWVHLLMNTREFETCP